MKQNLEALYSIGLFLVSLCLADLYAISQLHGFLSFFTIREGGAWMNTFPRQSHYLLVMFIVLFSIFFAPFFVGTSQADIGPEPILPTGSNIKPEDKTPIEMQSEKVILIVRKATESDNTIVNINPEVYSFDNSPTWFPAIAEVEADFTMQNPTNEAVSMTVWFPLASALEGVNWEDSIGEVVPSINRFQVMVKGRIADYSVSELPNPQGGDTPPLPWASFPVTFPAKEKVRIKISYILPAQKPETKWKDLIMTFNYIFQTGAGWAGPIGEAELVVSLPYPASPETIVALPAGGKVDGNQVRWAWENLEPGPGDDFSISMMQPNPWEKLKSARLAVRSQSKDGAAWVKLCETYHGLSYSLWHKIPGFGEVYPPLGLEACQEAAHLLPKSTPSDGQAWLDLCAIYYRLSEGETSDLSVAVQACQEAARLLPTDAAPHYGLAVLYLSGLSQNPSQAELQPVWDELKIGQELEAALPPSNKVSYFLPLYGLDDPPAEFITNWVNRISNIPTATTEQPTKTAAVETTLFKPYPIPPMKVHNFGGPYTEDSHTLLLLHLDGSYDGVQGEVGNAIGTEFASGRYGQGVLFDSSDTLTYTSANNLNRMQGAIEFWLLPNWDGDDEQSYVFFEVGKNWENRMRIMKDGANNLRFMVWDSMSEYGVSYNVSDWQAGDWHHVAVIWQGTDIGLYVDGQQVDSNRQAHVPDALSGTISIGSSSAEKTFQVQAVIDELRISDMPRLGSDESTPAMPQPSPTSAPTQKPTPTPTSLPSVTAQPLLTPTTPAVATLATPIPGMQGSRAGTGIGIVVLVAICLTVAGYIGFKRMRVNASK